MDDPILVNKRNEPMTLSEHRIYWRDGMNDYIKLKAEVAELADKLHAAYEAPDMDYKTIAWAIDQLRRLGRITKEDLS